MKTTKKASSSSTNVNLVAGWRLRLSGLQKPTGRICGPFYLSMENPQLGWGFRKAFSFKSVIKTPFDLLKHLAVWQLQKFNKKSKGGPNGGR
ncbi:hypothetical protein, partial [Salmonella enterica]